MADYKVNRTYVVTKDQPCWETGGLFLRVGDRVVIKELRGDSARVMKTCGSFVTIWTRDLEAVPQDGATITNGLVSVAAVQRADLAWRLSHTFFCVEATSFECLCLWSTHAALSPEHGRRTVDWQQVCSGNLIPVSVLDKRPNMLSLNFAVIDGRLILFWEATGEVVDHAAIERWFGDNWTSPRPSNEIATCNAMNFSHCLNAIADANTKLALS